MKHTDKKLTPKERARLIADRLCYLTGGPVELAKRHAQQAASKHYRDTYDAQAARQIEEAQEARQ
jgi:hypothetical protein